MEAVEIHECGCANCQQVAEHPDKGRHRQINVFLSRLDEQQRRWYAALEADRLGPGGDRRVSEITGLDERTIRRGREELAGELAGRPLDRVRLVGGGRLAVEKKIR